MKTTILLLASFAVAGSALAQHRIAPPLWKDPDQRPVPKPREQQVSELYAIVNNSWLRHLSLEEHALAARDTGALNVNAWDGVPDSSWFTNRLGRYSLTYDQLLASLEGEPPRAGRWLVERNVEEGYTPKFRIKDSAGNRYWIKFDLPDALERNSAAERIGTIILHAAGYNVPFNTVVRFRAEDLSLAPDARFTDYLNRQRPMVHKDLFDSLARLKKDQSGFYRALASHFIAGEPLGKFKYNGTRQDDANDIIPHELRRELRGLRVVASWFNHCDAGDKNTHDAFQSADGKSGWVKHYLLDFGSALGSGNYVNGPYRMGHEHIFDGSAISKTFWSFGAWRRPWEASGHIHYPEVGYFTEQLFDPAAWRANYPNLAFVRMDLGDAYWAARIVGSFPDDLIDRIVADAAYSRPEVSRAVAGILKMRRDLIVSHWLRAVTPIEDPVLDGDRLRYRASLAHGTESGTRSWRGWLLGIDGRKIHSNISCDATGCDLQLPRGLTQSPPDRFGRSALARAFVQSSAATGNWAAPVEIVLGRPSPNGELAVLAWRHGTR